MLLRIPSPPWWLAERLATCLTAEQTLAPSHQRKAPATAGLSTLQRSQPPPAVRAVVPLLGACWSVTIHLATLPALSCHPGIATAHPV